MSADGLLIVDKPCGPTSHDVVAQVRRLFRCQSVGHAGTLDPAASGVLVIGVGEGTKLVRFLGDHDKAYEARVAFGHSTTTLDAEGETDQDAPVPDNISDELVDLGRGVATSGPVATAIDAERLRTEQVPPAFSAIKQGGRPVYELARRGKPVVLAPRPVGVRSLQIVAADRASLVLTIAVSKGYYVRSLARDLGAAVGVPAHLAALRRIRSGPFLIDEAIPMRSPRESCLQALIPLAAAARRVLPISELLAEGVQRALHGKVLAADHFAAVPDMALSAWLGPDGRLVAIGRLSTERQGWVVERGFGCSLEPPGASA